MALNPSPQDKRGIVLRNYDNTFDARTYPNGDKPQSSSAPSAITDLARGTMTSSGTSLSWTLPADADNIKVYQRDVTASGAFGLIATLGAASSYNVAGLTDENQYEWKVAASNADGDSTGNNVVSGTTTAIPAGQEVTITGSGFGLEPNVVFYRTFKEAVEGQEVQQFPPAGEVGSIHQSGEFADMMTYGEVYGEKCLIGFDNGNKLTAQLRFPATDSSSDDAVQSFNWFCELAVPTGDLMPGSDSTTETEPNASQWKPFWFLNEDGANSAQEKPDFCTPTHLGYGKWMYAGNSINYGLDCWTHSEPRRREYWSWDGWNVFQLIQKADPSNPQTSAHTQYSHFTSPRISSEKTTGTFSQQVSKPAFEGNFNNAGVDADAHYRLVNINSYAVVNDTEPAKTQAAYGPMYLASSSPQGTENYRQMVFLGDAATWDECTKKFPKIADTWLPDEKVVVTVTADEIARGYTYALVYKPDDTVVSTPIPGAV